MRIVGFDVSRSVAEIAYLEHGALHAGGRTGLRYDQLEHFVSDPRTTPLRARHEVLFTFSRSAQSHRQETHIRGGPWDLFRDQPIERLGA